MVAVFVRLKWALTTGRLRASTSGARIGTAIGLLVGLAISGLIGVSLAALRWQPDYAAPVIGLVFTLQLLAWMLAPLVAFGVDETIDPRRFALLPLSNATVQRGLLASAAVGYLPVFNIVMLAGAAVGLSTRWALLPVALVCCAIQMVLCIVFSRAAATSMVALLSSRRGRDLGMAIGLVLMGGYFAIVMLANTGGATVSVDTMLDVITPLKFGPPGALAWMTAPGTGGYLAIGVPLIALFLALGWWWWSVALRRTMTTVPSMTASNSAAGSGGLGRSVASTWWGTVRVVAARDTRLAWRDPARRLPWAVVLLFTIAWPFIYHGAGALFAVVLGAVMVGAQTANYFGVEGSGLWLHLVTYADRMRARGEVAGHAFAALVPGSVAVAAGLGVQVAVRGHSELLPAAIGVCAAGLLGALGAGCWISAAIPFAMPQSRTSVFASSVAGQKGRAAGASFSLLGIAVATAVPAVVAAVLANAVDPRWGYVGIVVGVVSGAIVLAGGIRAGARRFLTSGPEIFAVASGGDRV